MCGVYLGPLLLGSSGRRRGYVGQNVDTGLEGMYAAQDTDNTDDPWISGFRMSLETLSLGILGSAPPPPWTL